MARNVGPYELIRRLAVGGAAEIYLARKGGLLGFEQHYALKVLLPHRQEDPEHRKMMVDEARLTAQLDHPNIIKVHDLGEDDNVLFMVMEYVNGLNLAQILERLATLGQEMPIEAAVFVASEACGGLHYAHTRKSVDGSDLQLVHRDVSPQNVLVGYGGEIKLIDFGVAKASIGGRLETKTGIIKGKLTYMAPEYAIGSQQDHRSDVFAIGLCLYEMLTGRAAYDIEDPREMVEAVKDARIQRPTRADGPVPDEIAKVLERALERSSDDRWQSAQELQSALGTFLSHHAPDYRREHLSAWITTLRDSAVAADAPRPEREAPKTQAPTHGTQHGLPAVADAQNDMNAVVATQALHLEDEGLRPRSAPNRLTELGMPLTDPAAESGPQSRAELLGLDSLREFAKEGGIVEDSDVGAGLATLATDLRADDDADATQGQPAIKPIPARLLADDEPTPDPGIQVQRDFLQGEEIATAPTAAIEVAVIAPERGAMKSELPTAMNIDVEMIRGDVVQKVAQPGRPQILTQSGFQEFASRPQRLNRPTEPHGLSTDPSDAALSSVSGERSVELLHAPVVQEDGPPADVLPAVIVEPQLPPPALPPLEKRIPGQTPPEPDPSKKKDRLSESATALMSRFSENYDSFSKTESGRKTTDALIVAVLGATLFIVLSYIFFFAD